MIEIDVFSGFLGAGKTTLIKKLIKEAYAGEKIVLIENEFGEIGIDGGFMKDAGIEITEINSGCICCSLVGDFGEALNKVINELEPQRILIEPSGVGKLSDVIGAITRLGNEKAKVGGAVTVVDANKFKVYSKNFGEFFFNQIEHAATVILSHTENISAEKLADCVAKIREKNPDATIVTTPWTEISGAQILAAIRQSNSLEAQLAELEKEARENAHNPHHHHHHHDHGEDGEECCCGHHHDDDDDDEHEHEHEHHHHHHDDDDDEECCCGHHHHHDDDDDDDDDHDHEHEHHHHHHHGDGDHDADEVFTSWGLETTRRFTPEEITGKLEALMDESLYGTVLRAKGIVPAADGRWIHFDYVPGEPDVRFGTAEVTGRLCVIGSGINKKALAELFA
ncbi:MAG: GTP-binding protein [Clostridia bacterium]|nr:GTP-binding protein [Clostridia bacterium]